MKKNHLTEVIQPLPFECNVTYSQRIKIVLGDRWEYSTKMMMSAPKKVKFNNSMKYFFEIFNEGHVMESVALCRFIHIHQDLKKQSVNEEDLLNNSSLYETIKDSSFINQLGSIHYRAINLGYLSFTEYDFNDFLKLKWALNYPNLTLATCPDPSTTKKKLMDKIKHIVEQDKTIVLSEKQTLRGQKYREYVFFNVRNILSYCSQFDHDFLALGQEIFDDFNKKHDRYNPWIHNLIATTLNDHFKQVKKENDSNIKKNSLFDFSLCYQDKDLKIENLYNHLVKDESINVDLFKTQLNSYKKGQLGENIFGNLFNSQVIGHENKKSDIIEKGHHLSLKTSFSDSWNHHLAYLNQQEHAPIIDALNNKEALFRLKNMDWSKIIHSLISGAEQINELVFQQIILDELNENPVNIKIWRFPVNKIVEMVKNKQFIFNHNNLILFHDQEQSFKLYFKKRTNGYQVTLFTDENSLNNLIHNHFGQFEEPLPLGQTFSKTKTSPKK